MILFLSYFICILSVMHYVTLKLERIFNPRRKTLTKDPWKTPNTSLFLCNVEMWLQSYVARNPLQNGAGGGGKEAEFSKVFQGFFCEIVASQRESK